MEKLLGIILRSEDLGDRIFRVGYRRSTGDVVGAYLAFCGQG